jgi:hypothetical protein
VFKWLWTCNIFLNFLKPANPSFQCKCLYFINIFWYFYCEWDRHSPCGAIWLTVFLTEERTHIHNMNISCPAGEPSSHALMSRRRFRRKKKSSASESESSPPSPKYSTASSSTIGDSEVNLQTASGTEYSDSGGGSLPPSPKPALMWAGPWRKISDSLLVPSRSRPTARLRAQHSCPESTCSHSCKVQEGQTHMHPPLLHSSTLYYPPLAHQSSVVAAPSSITAPSSTNHMNCHCHSEELELLNQKFAAAEEVLSMH